MADQPTSDRPPFGLWTLAAIIGWIAGTITAFVVIWRLWMLFPRG
jgi:hypothetical protein